MGIGATAVIDLWVQLLRRSTGIPATDWGVVGRWLTHILRNRRFILMSDTLPVPYERALGWMFHYGVGVGYGVLYIVLLHIMALPV